MRTVPVLNMTQAHDFAWRLPSAEFGRNRLKLRGLGLLDARPLLTQRPRIRSAKSDFIFRRPGFFARCEVAAPQAARRSPLGPLPVARSRSTGPALGPSTAA